MQKTYMSDLTRQQDGSINDTFAIGHPLIRCQVSCAEITLRRQEPRSLHHENTLYRASHFVVECSVFL